MLKYAAAAAGHSSCQGHSWQRNSFGHARLHVLPGILLQPRAPSAQQPTPQNWCHWQSPYMRSRLSFLFYPQLKKFKICRLFPGEGDIDIIPQPRHSKIRGHLKTSLIIGLVLIQYLIYYSLIEYVGFTGDTKLEHHGVCQIARSKAQTSTYRHIHPIPQLILSNFLFLKLQIAGVFDDRLSFCIN